MGRLKLAFLGWFQGYPLILELNKILGASDRICSPAEDQEGAREYLTVLHRYLPRPGVCKGSVEQDGLHLK